MSGVLNIIFIFWISFQQNIDAENPCVDNKLLNDPTRSINHTLEDTDPDNCDRYITEGWYRVANNGIISQKCPEILRCGSMTQIWLSGDMPAAGERKEMTACLRGFTTCCMMQFNIDVQNCGRFIVYKLSAPPACPGRYCTDVDICSGITCKHGGECVEDSGSFKCKCTERFEGTFCENEIDVCNTIQCQNNGSCINDAGQFRCECLKGFQGSLCETDIDDCLGINCENKGRCVDQIGNYTCKCLHGFAGEHCETDVDDCIGINCENAGRCVDQIGNYTCECLHGFEGKHCEKDVDDCLGINCENGGRCVDQIGNYTCECLLGFEGKHCENDVDDCLGINCENGGRCVDQIGNYTCECLNGFEGKHCENVIKVLCDRPSDCSDGESCDRHENCPSPCFTFIRDLGRCIRLGSKRLSWLEASKSCERLNGSLAIIDCDQKQQALRKKIRNLRRDWWIGATQNQSKTFHWTNGQQLIYTNWFHEKSEEPSGQCVAMDFQIENNYSGQWSGRNCSHQLNYICEINPIP